MKNKRLFLLPVLLLFAMSIALPALAAVDDSYTKALLHFDGADGSTTITDESGKTWTANGNAQLDTNQSKFGSTSLLLDGDGDQISTGDNNDFNLSGDFTFDFWVRMNTRLSYNAFFAQGSGSTANLYGFGYSNGTKEFQFFVREGGTSTLWITASDDLAAGTWYHVAIVRTNNNYYIFRDGTQKGTTTQSAVTIPNMTADFFVGYRPYYGNYFNGWIDEFRLTNGIARWTSNFTPPSSQYEPTPTVTPSPTNTATSTATFTPTATATNTETPTPTFTPTITDTPTNTPTITNTPIGPTATFTDTPTPTETLTPTNTPTITPTVPTSTPVTPAVTIVPEITYGEYAVTLSTAALCLVIIVIFFVAIGLYTSQRTRSK